MMKRLIALTALTALSVFGALPSGLVVWEARSTGATTNGGGFVTGSSGTDMSQFDNKNAAGCSSCQSATVNISTTDGVSTGTTTLTSATGNYSAALVGNVIRVGPTNLWFQVVTFTNSTTIVVDRAIGVGTGLAVDIGGAVTFLQGNTNMALANGSGMWVKATATYTTGSTISLASGMGNTGPSFIAGYTSTRGDNGQVTVAATAGLGGGNSFIFNYSGSPYAINLQNFKLDCTNQPFTRGVNISQAFEVLRNVWVANCADQAFFINQNGSHCFECWSTNTPSTTSGGSSSADAWINNNNDFTCVNCGIFGNAFNNAVAFNGMCGGVYVNMIMANFSGTNTDAMRCGVLEGEGLTILNASIFGFTRDAFQFSENSGIDFRPLLIRNAIVSNVGGYCFNYTGNLTLTTAYGISDHNVCNTTGALGFYNHWPVGVGDITITASPFTNGAGNDFSLNVTPAATIIGRGYPGVLGMGGTGFIDPGALQHSTIVSGGAHISGYAQ